MSLCGNQVGSASQSNVSTIIHSKPSHEGEGEGFISGMETPLANERDCLVPFPFENPDPADSPRKQASRTSTATVAFMDRTNQLARSGIPLLPTSPQLSSPLGMDASPRDAYHQRVPSPVVRLNPRMSSSIAIELFTEKFEGDFSFDDHHQQGDVDSSFEQDSPAGQRRNTSKVNLYHYYEHSLLNSHLLLPDQLDENSRNVSLCHTVPFRQSNRTLSWSFP